MTTRAAESTPGLEKRMAWHESTWRLRWVVVGIVLIVLWRVAFFWNWSWVFRLAPVAAYFGLLLGMQAFFIGLPLLTRDQGGLCALRWPGLARWLWEVPIAGALLIVILMGMVVAQWLLTAILPGQTFEPQEMKDLARSPSIIPVITLLVIAFTIAPLAEEVFFRGFLHNALHARLPLAFAILLQALLFGFLHPYSVAHSIGAALLGAVLTLIYEWRKTLLTPVLIHMGVNFVAALGVLILMWQTANSPMLGIIGDPQDSTCVIRTVVPGSPAEEADLRTGDVVTAVDFKRVDNFPQLTSIIQSYRAGDEIILMVERDGQALQVVARLRTRSSIAANR